ncbi:hypothetical protein LSAT2_031816 [Lamellibrachia satsuma]|nr:hypothetical protein LSAT2_031816 [Lamellibrachia satsuma]
MVTFRHRFANDIQHTINHVIRRAACQPGIPRIRSDTAWEKNVRNAVQCVGTPVCTRDANNRDVEWTLKQWLRFLYTKMVEGIRGNIGGGKGGGNSYNCNTFSLRKNWYNTDITSRPGDAFCYAEGRM